MNLEEFCKIIDGSVCYKSADFSMPCRASGSMFDVVTDSRDVKKGCIFVCLKGEFHDGHDYVKQASEDGAGIIIVNEDKKADVMKAIDDARAMNTSVISVKAPLYAMGELAKWYISYLGVKTIGITGSVGKTTVKDMVASVLSSAMNTYKTKGNFNSLIGLPLTALSMPRDTSLCVFELGMDAKGEIDRLSEIIAPDVAIITKIGVSHVERLGSRENIFRAKSEIVNHIKPGGTLILGVDEDEQYLKKENFTGNFNVIEVTAKHCTGVDLNTYCVENVRDDMEGIRFEFSGGDYEKIPVTINTHGIHNALNAGLAIACGLQFDIDLESIKEGLKNVNFTAKRLEIKERGGITFIDDSYNASPESMSSALRVLSQISKGRMVAVLGDMNELGKDSEDFHKRIGRLVFDLGIEELIAVGEKGRGYIEGFSEAAEIEGKKNDVQIVWIEDSKKCRDACFKHISEGDWVLLKASNALKLSSILEDE